MHRGRIHWSTSLPLLTQPAYLPGSTIPEFLGLFGRERAAKGPPQKLSFTVRSLNRVHLVFSLKIIGKSAIRKNITLADFVLPLIKLPVAIKRGLKFILFMEFFFNLVNRAKLREGKTFATLYS